MSSKSPYWIAQREGQDWVDEDILRAVDWMTSVVPKEKWMARMAQVENTFATGRQQWQQENRIPLFDPADAIAWYVFQATAFASRREDWFEPEAYRIVSIFKRLGKLLPAMKTIGGVSDRVEDLMWKGRKQPDQGLYELLVAGAYRSREWPDVAFVHAPAGGPRTHDLAVSKGRRQWAVECKRLNSSDYEGEERARGELLADQVHKLCKARGESLVLLATFKVELTAVPDHYLAERAESFLKGQWQDEWNDDIATVYAYPPDWVAIQSVLDFDDVSYGGSRLTELLVGEWLPYFDHSVSADWVPARGRPFYATSISRASAVSWTITSHDAARRKAKHFRAVIADAVKQLPGDSPAAIHVGYEARNGNSVDEIRHQLNAIEMETFDPGKSRLRWVYANYMSPEHANDRNESAAISETTAAHRIGRHRTSEPLPNHLLISDGHGIPGDHW